MACTVKRDSFWLEESFPSSYANEPLAVLVGEGHNISVPASILLAVSPLVRSIVTDVFALAQSPLVLLFPAVCGDVLEVVGELLLHGTSAVNVDMKKKVDQVFEMINIGASFSFSQLDVIRLGGVFDTEVKNVGGHGGGDLSCRYKDVKGEMEITVKVEQEESMVGETEIVVSVGRKKKMPSSTAKTWVMPRAGLPVELMPEVRKLYSRYEKSNSTIRDCIFFSERYGWFQQLWIALLKRSNDSKARANQVIRSFLTTTEAGPKKREKILEFDREILRAVLRGRLATLKLCEELAESNGEFYRVFSEVCKRRGGIEEGAQSVRKLVSLPIPRQASRRQMKK